MSPQRETKSERIARLEKKVAELELRLQMAEASKVQVVPYPVPQPYKYPQPYRPPYYTSPNTCSQTSVATPGLRVYS